MCPTQLPFLLFIVFNIFLSPLSLRSTSFPTRSVQLSSSLFSSTTLQNPIQRFNMFLYALMSKTHGQTVTTPVTSPWGWDHNDQFPETSNSPTAQVQNQFLCSPLEGNTLAFKLPVHYLLEFRCPSHITKLNSVALVRTRTIPTERPPPVGEVSANFCG